MERRRIVRGMERRDSDIDYKKRKKGVGDYRGVMPLLPR